MKKLISLALLTLSIIAAQASAMAPPVMPPNTNDWPLYALAQHANAVDAKLSYVDGKVELLQHQLDHMQTGFLVLILIVVVAVIGICILVARKNTTAARVSVQEAYAGAGKSKAIAGTSASAKK